jgi:hypothetical protein
MKYVVIPMTSREKKETGYAWRVVTSGGIPFGMVKNLREVDALIAAAKSGAL